MIVFLPFPWVRRATEKLSSPQASLFIETYEGWKTLVGSITRPKRTDFCNAWEHAT